MDERYVFAEAHPHIQEAMQIWTKSAVTLLDIRHRKIEAEEPLEAYQMPSGMFICTYGGAAEVRLNAHAYQTERFGFFHGGQGTCLSLSAAGQSVECFLLYYRAEAPPFYRVSLNRLMRVVNPFIQIYGFAPRQPLRFVELLDGLYRRWSSARELDHLYGKSVLYQMIYALYEEMQQGSVEVLQPDPAMLVKQYITAHYGDNLSLQALAERFHISPAQLSRSFKRQEGISPQEYLIRTRIAKVRMHLSRSDARLREIALACGFSDEFSLIKSFKSVCGITPGDYRKMSSIRMSDSTMGNQQKLSYAEGGPAWLDHLQEEGEYTMYQSSRVPRHRAWLAASLAMMLLLSACGGTANSTNNGNQTPSRDQGQGNTQQTAVQQQTPATDNGQSTSVAMRTFDHLGGTSDVPEKPQRIVADWYYGELLALGIRPIAYPEYLLSEYTYVEPDGTVALGEAIEQVVDMEPDLIISTWDDSYKAFEKIAPSVLLKLNDGLYDKMRVLGDLVDRKQEAEDWIVSFEQKLEAAKARITAEAAPDTTVTILGIFQKDLKVYAYHNMGGDVLYNLLEVNPPVQVQEMFKENEAWNLPISFEVLPEIAGTYILLCTFEPEGSGRELLAQLEASEIWRSLDAVQNNRVHKFDYYDLFFDDPIAIEHQIEMLTDMIVGK